MWIPFWGSFNSAIRENPELTKVDKFNYLTSLVSHSALEAISGLILTTANCDDDTEILRKQIGHKQLIINQAIEHLLNSKWGVFLA